MSTIESTNRASLIPQIALLVVFVIGVFAPGVGMITGWSADIAVIEFRNPEPAPPIPTTMAEFESFPSVMDKYLDDHFGFRGQLLTANSLLYVAIGVSPSPHNIVGKAGWFFHRDMDHVLDQYRGVNRFTPEELERWIELMEANQHWLAERGVRMLIAIAPSKHNVYPEYLPDWVNVVDEDRRYQQLMRRVAQGSTLEFVDLLTPLLEAKERFRVYHKTDGHWNQLGAYIAYAAIVERIRETLPQVPLRPLENFDLEWVSEPTGSIVGRLNIARQFPEKAPKLRPRWGSHMVREMWPEGQAGSILDLLHATSYIDSDLKELPTVVFVRDSFATDISLFARESFRRTVMIHHGYGGFRRNYVMRFKPDVVVLEMVERGLEWNQRH